MVSTGRVTLLGDLAHAMPTEKGLGGNNVLEDARLLSALLTSTARPINWVKLIGEYETEMFARAKADSVSRFHFVARVLDAND